MTEDRIINSIQLDWIGLDWIGLDWIGLDWIGLDWIGLAAYHITRRRWIVKLLEAILMINHSNKKY